MNQDIDHLRILSIFHYIVGGITGLAACIPLIHFTLGLLMATGMMDQHDPVLPAAGMVLMAIAGAFILAGWALAICLILAGRRLAARQSYNFCLVVAAVGCIFMPFGTVLGIFTIIVLMRPSVRGLFGMSGTLCGISPLVSRVLPGLEGTTGIG